MNKLFKLKEWLTVADAARYLAIAFGEGVTEADVLRLGLDGRLWLSVYFVNHASARRGKTVPLSKAERVPGIPLDKNGKPREPYDVILGLKLALKQPNGQVEEKVVQFDKKIVSLEGVWDLTMFGGERLDIEHKYQMLTNGVEVTLVNIDGVYVQNLDGEICELQTSFDDNEYQPGSRAQLEELKAKIASEQLEKSEVERLLNQHKEDRKKFLKGEYTSEKYYPASGLPDDSVLVVRTDALRKFEQSINDAPARHTNVSEKLAIMNQASAKFWANADRDDRGTHPSNKTVTVWLVQQGFTTTLAEKSATLIRPEWVPTGRKPEE